MTTSRNQLESWLASLRSLQGRPIEDIESPYGPINLGEWLAEQDTLVAEITLVGNPEVVRSAQEATYTLAEWADNQIEQQTYPAFDPDDMRSRYQAAKRDCVDAMRRDLGAPPITPSRKSLRRTSR